MVCEACKILEDNSLIDLLSPQTKKWWKEHKEFDLNRKK